MRDFLLQRWAVVMMLALFLFLAFAHAAMLHWSRPEYTIKWCEEMIMMTFTALITKLKD